MSNKLCKMFFLPMALILSACDKNPPNDPIPTHDSFQLDSVALSEKRLINVYVPPEYSKHSDAKFPVLYMPDGGVGEDFPHIVNTISELIGQGMVRPMIVVGIENTVRHRDLTGSTVIDHDNEQIPINGGSENFRKFIRDELMPEVNRSYRCSGATGIIGESLAGLFVIETFLVEPKLFDVYIAISPSLWWNDHQLVRNAAELLKQSEGLDKSLYLSSADELDIYPHTDQLKQILERHAPDDLNWIYEPRRDLKHQTIFRAISPIAFRKMFGWEN